VIEVKQHHDASLRIESGQRNKTEPDGDTHVCNRAHRVSHVGSHVPVDRTHVACGQAGNEFLEEVTKTSEGFVITLLFMVEPILVTLSEQSGSFRAGP
jgi:hypothetical protein